MKEALNYKHRFLQTKVHFFSNRRVLIPLKNIITEQKIVAKQCSNLFYFSGIVVGSATAAAVAHAAAAAAAAAAGQSGTVQNALELGQVQQTPGGALPASVTNTVAGNSTSSRSQHGHQNNSGVCQICNKTFRQLRSHIQDVHNPTATPCPLCGKVFQSKHKMFGHKYRSCPNRTRNLVRHLEDIDPQGGVVSTAGSTTTAGGTPQPSQTSQLVAVSAATPQQPQPGQPAQHPAAHQQQPPPF